MNTIGLKFISNEAKKLVKSAIGISKKIVRTYFRLQYNVAVFPVYFVYGGLTYVYKKSFAPESENVPPSEPRSADVVRYTRNIRTSLLSTIRAIDSSRRVAETNRIALNDSVNQDQQNKREDVPDSPVDVCSDEENFDRSSSVAFLGVSEFSGSKLMWDIPIISAKASYFAQCHEEKKEDYIAAARKALEEHSVNSPMPNTRQEYNEMIKKARNEPKYSSKSSVIEVCIAEPRNDVKCEANDNMVVESCVFEENSKQVQFRVNEFCRHSPKHKTKLSCDSIIPQNKIRCREVTDINKTLRKIHVTCSRLLGGLTNLNEGLGKVISMKEKLTSLEFQVDEGKRLLQEVESDRFIMKSKLSALEKLINEEEKFLSGDSCESGFYESENVHTVEL